MYLILRKTWFSGFYYPFLVTVVALVRCVKPTRWCARKQKTQSPPTFKYVPEYFYERRSVHAPVLTFVCLLNQNHLIHLLTDPFHSIFKLARFLSRIRESIRGCVRPLVHPLVSQSVGLSKSRKVEKQLLKRCMSGEGGNLEALAHSSATIL